MYQIIKEGEVKAEPSIATATSAPPKEEKACNSATLSPKREVVCVSLSPVKVGKKRKDRTPSPSSPKIVIDLTSEEEYATFPLTQLSEKEPSIYVLNEKESIAYEREMYRFRAWTATATPATVNIRGICPGIQRRYPGHRPNFCIICFFTLFVCWMGCEAAPKGRGCNLLMQFSTLCGSKMEIFKTNFFDILAIHNDQTSYVEHVLDPPHVLFTVFCLFGRGLGLLNDFVLLTAGAPSPFTTYTPKNKVFENDIFDIVATHNDHPTYVKHVLGGICVFFTYLGIG